MRSGIGNSASDPLFTSSSVGGQAPSPAGFDSTGVQKAPIYTPLGYQQISGPSNATLSVPTGARRAVVQAEAQGVRWRDDGTPPTATVGMTIATGGELRYDGNLAAIRFTQLAATAILNVAYYA